MDIVKQMRSFEIDHEPDGWPAVQMKQISALCDEIERLQSVVDASAALYLPGDLVRCDSEDDLRVVASVDLEHMTLDIKSDHGDEFNYTLSFDDVFECYRKIEPFARPIPAQQTIDRDTIINVLLSIGNVSEGVIADAIISAIGAQQSTAVAVPVMQEFSDDEYICIRDAVDRLISSVGKEVDGDQSECSLCADFIDDIIANVIVPLKIEWFEDEDESGYTHSASGLENMTRPSPRITEQDVIRVLSNYFEWETGFPSVNSLQAYIKSDVFTALLDKLNGDKNGK